MTQHWTRRQSMSCSRSKSITGFIYIPVFHKVLIMYRYYTYYHPLFPIAPELPHLLERYLSQLPLFWTMIAIASKTSKEHLSIYLGLSGAIPKLVEQILHCNGKELWMIQALLLLCCWPFPFGPKTADPSLSYSGLATNFALEMGIHRYKFPSDFKYDEPYDEDTAFMQKKMWLACFIVNQQYDNSCPR